MAGSSIQKFTLQEIEQFNDSIIICLTNNNCLKIFESYLKKAKKLSALKIVKLWQLANEKADWDDIEDVLMDIEGFNDNPLLSCAEYEGKLVCVKNECCRLLGLHNLHQSFIKYLRKNHCQ